LEDAAVAPMDTPVDQQSTGRHGDGALVRRLVESSPYILAVVDGEGVVRWVDGNTVGMTGWTADELVGTNILDHLDTTWNPAALESVAFAMTREGLQRPMLFRVRRKDGTTFVAEVTANARMNDPVVNGLVAYIRRWDERHLLDRVIESLAGSESLEDTLALLVEVMGAETLEADGVVLLGPTDDRAARAVAAAGLPVALRRDDGAVDTPWAEAKRRGEPQWCRVDDLPDPLGADARAEGYAACWAWPVHTNLGAEACLVLWRPDDEEPDFTCRWLLDNLVRVTSLVLEREHAARRLRHAASHDVLTGLANRGRFYDHLREIFDPAGAGPMVGVLYIDLDDFKPVNDRLGHRAGDLLLKEVARRLSEAVREGDLVARLGGDEFAIACAGVNSLETVRAVAERVTAAVRRPIRIDDELVTVGVTAGIALAEPGACSIDLLVDAADGALYEAKRDARGGWHVAPPIAC
jgi:diguanylate cyclase (GGDEF)-like protein/PAS domain S-box-containing protein